MKAGSDTLMLALMARVARVREIQSQQALAAALNQKEAQEQRAHEAQVRMDRTDEALRGVLRVPVVNLPSMFLLHEMSAHVQGELANEHELLSERTQEVADRMTVTSRRVRQRERLEERAAEVIDHLQQACDARHLELATEAWLACGKQGVA